jgi:hypothetical protein
VLTLISHGQIQFIFLYGLEHLFQAVLTYFPTNQVYYVEEANLFDGFQVRFFTTQTSFQNFN